MSSWFRALNWASDRSFRTSLAMCLGAVLLTSIAMVAMAASTWDRSQVLWPVVRSGLASLAGVSLLGIVVRMAAQVARRVEIALRLRNTKREATAPVQSQIAMMG